MYVKPQNNLVQIGDPEFRDLEALLVRNFEQVRPRQEFVQSLRGRLADPQVHARPAGTVLQNTLLIGAGILGSILIVAASIKTVLSLVNAYKVLRQSKA